MSPAPLKLHPESLLHVPLVRALLTDPHARLVARAVDKGWFYSGQVPVSVTGFYPLTGEVFYGARSFLAEWLPNAAKSARLYNEGDMLVPELFFAVHDYLHGWAYRAIRTLAPELGFGSQPITKRNIEDFAFCHLLTETVATVGLDYWYLSTTELNNVCDLGTCFRTLTAGYHDQYIGEYRRFNPKFEVQRKEFFREMVEFYCSGVLYGFDLPALRQSPRVLRWLEHELRYGETQRGYTRQWLAYLSSDGHAYKAGQLEKPVSLTQKWKQRLINQVAELLWEKVKLGQNHELVAPLSRGEAWSRVAGKTEDFRFLNLNALEKAEPPKAPESREFYLYQLISQHQYSPKITILRDGSGAVRLKSVFKGLKRLKPTKDEPENLFILN